MPNNDQANQLNQANQPNDQPFVDYVQILHNHVGGEWEDVLPSAAPGMHTLRLLVGGIEAGRASAGKKNKAKRINAYRYLRDHGLTKIKDDELEALLRTQP